MPIFGQYRYIVMFFLGLGLYVGTTFYVCGLSPARAQAGSAAEQSIIELLKPSLPATDEDTSYAGDTYQDVPSYEYGYTDCLAGKIARKKFGGRSWDFVSVDRFGSDFVINLTHTERHDSSPNASSIRSEQLCVVTSAGFRVSGRMKLNRKGKLVPAL